MRRQKASVCLRSIAMPDLHHPTDFGHPFLVKTAGNEGTYEKIVLCNEKCKIENIKNISLKIYIFKFYHN